VQGNDFYGMLRNEYAQRPPEKRSAFVFIHGFNVTFDDAAYRTAQLAYDLDFDGVPMMYSWPSQGRLLAYDGDRDSVVFSSPNLQSFLERVARESGALRIHLVAHSMGNQLLANALVALGRQPDIQPLFDNVIMAAPDVNAYTFTDQIWPGIKKAAKRFTLYASSDDEALKISKSSKGPNDFDRLGEAGPKIVVISGLDTVDASGIDTSLLGHSYVDTCKPVMDDVQMIMQKGLAPLQRKLHDHYREGLAYWTFR
jgi:esterase/lipase superfamily enzyme